MDRDETVNMKFLVGLKGSWLRRGARHVWQGTLNFRRIQYRCARRTGRGRERAHEQHDAPKTGMIPHTILLSLLSMQPLPHMRMRRRWATAANSENCSQDCSCKCHSTSSQDGVTATPPTAASTAIQLQLQPQLRLLLPPLLSLLIFLIK